MDTRTANINGHGQAVASFCESQHLSHKSQVRLAALCGDARGRATTWQNADTHNFVSILEIVISGAGWMSCLSV
jgi:hypothetical protein